MAQFKRSLKNTDERHRGLGKRIKYAIPEPLFEILRRIFNRVAYLFPMRAKYAVGLLLRRRKLPYSLLQDGDTVVQVGAPRDLLRAGRSRAVYFSRLVGSGKVIIIEPDPENCQALLAFLDRSGLARCASVIEKGVWHEAGELAFLSSPDHPAANVLVDAKEIDQSEMERRHYSVIKVPVDTLDSIAEQHRIGRPKLVSITTNGAERQVVDGMSEIMARAAQYVALAETGPNYPELMASKGYELLAMDDRGFTFRKASGNNPDA